MTIIPPYLKKGDIIGLVAPAGSMEAYKYKRCIETLENRGYHVLVGTTPGRRFNYFSGTDDERLEDLQQMLDNKDIKAILCVRGGYGTGRIIDRIDFKKFRKNPKWIIGFSDITVLHSHIFSNFHIATIHGPMASAFNEKDPPTPFVQSLLETLEGKRIKYKIPASEFNRNGRNEGILVGGNLSLFVNMIGTRSETDTRDKILFIEDVGEYLYNIDRMMYQLKRSKKLSKLSGLVVGSFNDMRDTTLPFGETIEQIVSDLVKDYDYPVCFHFPAGHQKENYALKLGAPYQLKTGNREVVLKEI